MRVLLCLPEALSKIDVTCVPNIGLGYLASSLMTHGHEPQLLHMEKEGLPTRSLRAYLEKHRPDVVGIQVWSFTKAETEAVIREVRKWSADVPILLGGPHCNVEPPERLLREFRECTFAIAGEAERALPLLLRHIEDRAPPEAFNDVPGLMWRDASGRVMQNEREFVSDLDSLGFPAWEIMDPRTYRDKVSFWAPNGPSAPMIATRGCPFRCKFCESSLHAGLTVRKRSVEGIVEEIEYLRRTFNVRTIEFLDENLLADKLWATNLFETFISRDLKISWAAPSGVRVDQLEEGLVRLMERSGCFSLHFGIESGSDRVLDLMRKGFTVEETRRKLAMVKRVSSILMEGSFILGYPDETIEEAEATIDLAAKLPLSLAWFWAFMPVYGTAVYSELIAEGKLPTDRSLPPYWSRTHTLCEYSPRELDALRQKAHLTFYGRWHILRPILARSPCSPFRIRWIARSMRTFASDLAFLGGIRRYYWRKIGRI